MYVFPCEEGIFHSLIPGDVSEQTEFNLAVIRVYQDVSRSSHKHLAYLTAQLTPHGNILQVRLSRGETARGSDGHLEIRVYAPVRGNDLHEPVGVSALELGQHAVIQNVRDYGVFAD